MGQERFVSVRRVKSGITTSALRANPARVTADARSACFGEDSMPIESWMHNHALFSPDRYIGWIKNTQVNRAILDARCSFPHNQSPFIHLTAAFYPPLLTVRIHAWPMAEPYSGLLV